MVVIGWGRVAEEREEWDRAAHHVPPGLFASRSSLLAEGMTCHVLAYPCGFLFAFYYKTQHMDQPVVRVPVIVFGSGRRGLSLALLSCAAPPNKD